MMYPGRLFTANNTSCNFLIQCKHWMCLVIPCVSLGRDHAAHTGPHGGKVTVWGSAGQQEGRTGPRPHRAPRGSSGETRGYKWVHFNHKKYLSYCRSLLQHLILCLSSIFPECRVKRQSNPCWLDHNHMWPALVWSLSIGSSFMYVHVHCL